MENFANNFVTTLAAAIGAADASIMVASSTGSPAANFRIEVESEYMLVTAKSGNTWTVTRGIEGSVAAAHASAAELAQVLTVDGLKTLIDQQVSTKSNIELKPFNFSYGDASSIAFNVPANAIVLKVSVNISVPFNGAGASFTVGTAANNSLLIASSQIDVKIAAKFDIDPNELIATSTNIYTFITAGAGATQGSGWVTLEYATL